MWEQFFRYNTSISSTLLFVRPWIYIRMPSLSLSLSYIHTHIYIYSPIFFIYFFYFKNNWLLTNADSEWVCLSLFFFYECKNVNKQLLSDLVKKKNHKHPRAKHVCDVWLQFVFRPLNLCPYPRCVSVIRVHLVLRHLDKQLSQSEFWRRD